MGQPRTGYGPRTADHVPCLAESWRSLKVAAWLGWQIESNWTDPFLFAIYSVVKPVAGALILVFMYLVVARGGLANPLFPYIFVGNAFYIYVGAVLMGISWVVIDDREHYGMLKYLYTAPLNIYTYLVGRGAAQTAIATVATTITLLFGVGALGIRSHREGWTGGCLLGPSSSTGGARVPGAPPRRALLADGGNESLRAISTGIVILILAISTLVLAVASVLFFRWAERIAHRRGLLDMQTMH